VTDARPLQLSGYARLGALWVPFAIALGVLLAISLAHGIATTTQARRRDLAILSALGLKRSQAGAVVVWQALTTIIVSLAIALGTPADDGTGREVVWRRQSAGEEIDLVRRLRTHGV
jgi:hypothetical protein